jgi:hypothetical protein
VAQSDLALLRLAELTLQDGDKAAARGWRQAFRTAWPGGAPALAPRVARLEAALGG